MRLLSHWLTIASAVGWLSIAGSASADDSRSGAQLAATCAACHQFDHKSADDHKDDIASITGLEAGTLAGMMRAFQLNPQTNHVMYTVSRQLSDEEIDAVASYIADLGKAKGP
jgi:cytochrome c553